ncbi:helix-turn-helix domain-containing protein [Streptomyces sp. LN549]|uniref:helix-turn-helix domain-containing protein n=1 Tax=Streptomyces sp. LN549 TaxID=3112979 RepID=UPI00371A8A49
MRLAELRERAGLTQAEVATRMGTSQPDASRLERSAFRSRSSAPTHRRPAAIHRQQVHAARELSTSWTSSQVTGQLRRRPAPFRQLRPERASFTNY